MASLFTCCGLFSRSPKLPSSEVIGDTPINTIFRDGNPVKPKVQVVRESVVPLRPIEADDEVMATATIPAGGFLKQKTAPYLPSYRTRKELADELQRSRFSPMSVSFSDTLVALQADYNLARCVLFETARQRRSPFTKGTGLKLDGDAMILDKALVKMDEYLEDNPAIVNFKPAVHKAVMNDREFKDECGSAKKTMLRLEKQFRDTILRELQEGMISKKDIEHGPLIEKSARLFDEVKEVCNQTSTQYYEVECRVKRICWIA
ncbi:hypothetical protein QBC36DRAFT_334984 [Triangularia setosa]|uniref:Uncharacterized protein n=1 Tax=Triangularia setosa TaxID=2587417 RepID=A0AAN7A5C4_9PEZI|nr:hypothetical protein QBC36DRAFT_334984 [Podospora setosa]